MVHPDWRLWRYGLKRYEAVRGVGRTSGARTSVGSIRLARCRTPRARRVLSAAVPLWKGRAMLRTFTSAVAVMAGVAAGSSGQARGAAFTETFDDGLASGRWTVASQQEATRDPSTGPDGSVNFNFDYSTLGIAAPSGSTVQYVASVQTNRTEQHGEEGEPNLIYPNSYAQPYSGYWLVEADLLEWKYAAAETTESEMIRAYQNPATPIAT